MWSAAAEVAMLCVGASFGLDPWQVSALELILGERADGRWACKEAAFLVSRQNGKGGILHALDLAGLFLFDDVHEILHTAHEHKTAKKAYRELRDIIKGAPHLYAQVERSGTGRVIGFRHSNEDTSITLQNGDVIRFYARSNNSARGFSPQMVIMDEAQECSFDTRAALKNTLRAQRNPLIVWCGTVPTPKNNGEVFTMLRDRGRNGGDPALGWIEHTPPLDMDPTSDDAILWSNPALGYRLSWEDVVVDRDAALTNPDEWDNFLRECLSWWPDDAADAPKWGLIPESDWVKAADETGGDAGWLAAPVSLGVEMPPGRALVSISSAGTCRAGGDGIDLVSQVPPEQVGAELVALTSDPDHPVRHVVVDPASPAGAFIERDVKGKNPHIGGVPVVECTLKELKAATGDTIDRLSAEKPTIHHRNVEAMSNAAARAEKRKAGDVELLDRWADPAYAPLGAAILALHGHSLPVEEPKKYRAGGFR